jgi:hypothetical protein
MSRKGSWFRSEHLSVDIAYLTSMSCGNGHARRGFTRREDIGVPGFGGADPGCADFALCLPVPIGDLRWVLAVVRDLNGAAPEISLAAEATKVVGAPGLKFPNRRIARRI